MSDTKMVKTVVDRCHAAMRSSIRDIRYKADGTNLGKRLRDELKVLSGVRDDLQKLAVTLGHEVDFEASRNQVADGGG